VHLPLQLAHQPDRCTLRHGLRDPKRRFQVVYKGHLKEETMMIIPHIRLLAWLTLVVLVFSAGNELPTSLHSS